MEGCERCKWWSQQGLSPRCPEHDAAWIDEVVQRRFGRDHEKPCRRPDVLTCAKWNCQSAGACQAEDL
jgi:hypothetical protein